MNELCLEMAAQELITDSVTLHISYSHSWKDSYGYPSESSHGTTSSKISSCTDIIWLPKITQLYRKIVKRDVPIRRINITCNRVTPENTNIPCYQYTLFDFDGITDTNINTECTIQQQERNHRLQNAVLQIRQQYGKNAVIKGMNLEEAATGRERNRQIGGHKSGA